MPMDTARLARALIAAPTRRELTRWLAAGLAGIVAGGEPAAARNKKKKSKTCKPKCKTCQRCTRGKCKPAQEGKACGEGKICAGGGCFARRCGTGGPCRVFVTAQVVGADFGGLVVGNAICQSAATAAGLTGDFLAWLSTGADSPLTRFTNRDAAGPYRLVPNAADNGNPPPTVADSFADLTACEVGSGLCLQHPIDRTEAGVVVSEPAAVWTGTLPDGTAGSRTCLGWTTNDPVESGLFGLATVATAGWTGQDFVVACGNTLSLYCFEQA
jgi:hypothetical protein